MSLPYLTDKKEIPSAILRLVGRQLQGKLTSPLLKVARGELSIEAAGQRAFGAFQESHANAVYAGRLSAGNKTPIQDIDRESVRLLAEEQTQYFERFAKQVEDGKYTNDKGELNEAAIEDRAGLYSLRLQGTANDGWASALDDDDLVEWKLGDTENSCSICPDLAQQGPYKASELPTTPGSFETSCLWNCGCSLESVSGSVPPKSFASSLKWSDGLRHKLLCCRQ